MQNRISTSIVGLAEVVLNVNDIEKMKAFYQEVFGFNLLSEGNMENPPNTEGIPTIVFLEVHPINTDLGQNGHPMILALIDPLRHGFTGGKFDSPHFKASTLNHLAFEISPDSYDAHLSRLKELNLSPTESEFPNMQAKAIFFRDPENNTLELICHHKTSP
ncbi:MAG: VOC family protein [Fimbriimonadaceae bacterium]